MKLEQSFNLQMFQALRTFFDNYADVVETSPMLKADVRAYNGILATLEDKIEEENLPIAFRGEDKAAMKEKIATNIRRMLDKLTAHAIKTQDAALKMACKTAKTSFTGANDADFVRMANLELARMTQYAKVLDGYLLDENFRLLLKDSVAMYEKLSPQMRVDRVKSMATTRDRNDLFKGVKEYVECVLAAAVDSLTETQPAFVKEYQDVSTGRTPSVTSTKLVVKTVFDDTNLPAPFVQIDLPEVGISGTTDEKGHLMVKVGGKKELRLNAAKPSLLNEELSVTKIKRGRVTEIEVRMKSATLGLVAAN
jgi:hypothetical protein